MVLQIELPNGWGYIELEGSKCLYWPEGEIVQELSIEGLPDGILSWLIEQGHVQVIKSVGGSLVSLGGVSNP